MQLTIKIHSFSYNEWMNEWMNEWETIEWMNEWMRNHKKVFRLNLSTKQQQPFLLFTCSNCNGCLVKKYCHLHCLTAEMQITVRPFGGAVRAWWLVSLPGARRFVPRRFLHDIVMGAISSKVVTISSEVVEVFFLRRRFELFFFLSFFLCC